MKNILIKTKHFVNRNRWWSGAATILFLIIFYFVFLRGSKGPAVETVIVENRNIMEEVSVTGNVNPLSDLSLSFEKSGLVSNIAVSVGDTVYQGQALAWLSNADLSAAVEQAKAGLKIAQANLTSLQNGTRPEQLIIAKGAFDDAQKNLNDKINDGYIQSDDAIRNNIDQMFANPKTPLAKINISFNNSQLETNINNERYAIELMLAGWNGTAIAGSVAEANLTQIKNFLDDVAFGVNTLTANSNISQTTIDKYKATVSAARSSISGSLSGLLGAESAYNTAKSTYNLDLAGSTAESISAQQAAVEQAQANLDSANAQLSKSIIRSPITGVISRIDAKIGQVTQPGANAVSVISYGDYEVESFVPEADIAKIKLGQQATTTLDAYGSDTLFTTEVIKIDPAETVIEGVPTYKITLKFISKDTRIKSGMTANMDILTNKKNNTLAVPSRSVYSVDTKRYVKVIDSKNVKKTIEKEVKTGIRGIDGYVEILSGLSLGEKIVASPNI